MNVEEQEVEATAEERWINILETIESDESISDYLDADTGLNTVPDIEHLNIRKRRFLSRSQSSETVHEVSRNSISYDDLAYEDDYAIEQNFLLEYCSRINNNIKEFCVLSRVETFLKMCRMFSPYGCVHAEKQLVRAVCFLSLNNCSDSQLVVELMKNIQLEFENRILTLDVDNSVMEYMLHHAKKMNFKLASDDDRHALCLSIFSETVDRVATLLNYGLQRKYSEQMLDGYILLLDLKLSGESNWNNELEPLFSDDVRLREERRENWNNNSGRRYILTLETLSILMIRELQKIETCTLTWSSLFRLCPLHSKYMEPYVPHDPRLSYSDSRRMRVWGSAYMDADGKGSNSPDMVNLIWRSVPDPFLSHVEMYSILERMLPRRHEERFEALCAAYRDSGCEGSDAPPSPRSLAHLCRCVVRERLMQNDQLPEGVEALRLPQHLKSYLLLKF